MAKKPLRRDASSKGRSPKKASNKRARQASQKKVAQKETQRLTSDPWLSRRTGMTAMAVISLGLAAFMVWQLLPSQGIVQALLWGVGFGVALWGVFYLSLAFNNWIRGRR